MKKLFFLAVLAMVITGLAFVSCDSPKTFNLKSDIDSVSVIIGARQGYLFRESIKQNPDPPLNLEAFINGYVNGAKGDTIFLGMELQEANMYLNTFMQEFQNRITERDKAEADKFLAENRGNSGVSTTESGLQYQVITEGKGPKPKTEDVVKVHFQINLMNGDLVENTFERGEPIEVQVEGLFPGWKEGVLMMSVGSKYKLWIPMELGVGMANPQFNKLLIMEVELLEIVK